MINLLPPDHQKDIRAAYSNTLLLRYVVLSIAAVAFLLGALVFTYISLVQAGDHADAMRAQNEQQAIGYTETQAAVTQLQSDLTAAKDLFDNEIRYSKIITRLSNILPGGTAIDALQITENSFTAPTTLSVKIRNQAAAKALQDSFMQSPYVTNVSLGRITTTDSSQYPYSAELSFTLDRSIAQ